MASKYSTKEVIPEVIEQKGSQTKSTAQIIFRTHNEEQGERDQVDICGTEYNWNERITTWILRYAKFMCPAALSSTAAFFPHCWCGY